MICLFMSELGDWGVAQTQWPFLLLHKGTGLSVPRTYRRPLSAAPDEFCWRHGVIFRNCSRLLLAAAEMSGRHNECSLAYYKSDICEQLQFSAHTLIKEQ